MSGVDGKFFRMNSCSSPSLARVKQLHINACTPHMLTRSRLVLKCGKTHCRVSGPALGRTLEPSRSQLAQLPWPSCFQPSHHSSPMVLAVWLQA